MHSPLVTRPKHPKVRSHRVEALGSTRERRDEDQQLSSATVRDLARADLPQLMELYAQLHPDDPPVDDRELAQTWSRIASNVSLLYLGAFVGDQLVSTCHAAIVPNLTRSARPYAVIENVVTRESYRRRGIGALAMHTLIARCWQAGCYKVMLMSGAKRAAVHGFYRSLGFDVEAKQAFVLTRPTAAKQSDAEPQLESADS